LASIVNNLYHFQKPTKSTKLNNWERLCNKIGRVGDQLLIQHSKKSKPLK
jgi:hypothetical protein